VKGSEKSSRSFDFPYSSVKEKENCHARRNESGFARSAAGGHPASELDQVKKSAIRTTSRRISTSTPGRQYGPAKTVPAPRQPAPVLIGQPQASSAQLRSEDPVFLDQIR